jgi:hypothetical protein
MEAASWEPSGCHANQAAAATSMTPAIPATSLAFTGSVL